jgi:glutaminyl-tRNA synthetase
VVTRFPPEPNGYLHLGHAKSINFNFAVAKAYKGVTHMRFDDTNPAKEEVEYINSILQDVKWLVKGDVDAKEMPWFGPVRHASDYFQTIYDSAEYLIKQGLAYVDELSAGKCHAHCAFGRYPPCLFSSSSVLRSILSNLRDHCTLPLLQRR